MNKFFFYEKNISFLNFFFKKKKIFLFKKHLKNNSFLNKITFIKDDIYNFRDHANVAIKSLEILETIHLSKYSSQDKLLNEVFKRNLLINIEDILRTICLYEKIKEEYKLDEFYICKFFNDLELFNYLKGQNLIPNNIKISKIYYIANKIYLYLEKIYFFFNLMLLPEKILLLCRKNIKKKYNAILNVNEEPIELNSGYMYIKKKLKKTTLIVKDLQLKESFFKKSYKKNKNLNIFFLKNIFNNISLYSYLRKFYSKYFLERFKLFFSLNNNYKEIYRYFCNKICWEIFFNSFEVNKCLTAMQPWDLTSQYIQKKNSKETIFIYFSSTPNFAKTNNSKIGVDQIQYNFMNYTTLISNNISRNYLDKKLNCFNNFLDFGNLDSSLAQHCKKQKNFLKKKHKIDKKKFIIGVFDNSIGFNGILSSSEYLKYLRYLNYLILKYKDFYFIFRKKNHLKLFSSETHNYKNLNIELKKLYNYKNFSDLNYKLSTPEIIAVSDIVLAHPYSSIIFDALLAHKTTIIFDNMKKKIESDDLYSEINKKINIHNLKYKFRLLDSDILNILKINSNNSYKLVKNYKDLNFFDEVSKYIDKHNETHI